MNAVPFAVRRRVFRHVVVLTGAGISVASGLRPYRGPGGLWTAKPELAQQLVAGVDSETLWDVGCEWRKEVDRAAPNAAHLTLAAFEAKVSAAGASFTLITQNVDGLHAAAGSQNVVELHGSLRRSRCSRAECTALLLSTTAKSRLRLRVWSVARLFGRISSCSKS